MHTILGASGKVGGSTIRALRQRGADVRALVRDPQKAHGLEALGCEVVTADLHAEDSLVRAFAGSDVVQVLCPMLPQASNARSAMTAFVDTLTAALETAKPRAVVAISDYGAEHESGTGITTLFHYFERKLRRLQISLTLLRSAEHMQNWSRVAAYAQKTGVLPTMHHPLSKRFPTVSALDVGVIAADVQLPVRPESWHRELSEPRIVHVEGPERYTAIDVATAVGSKMGREIVAQALPRRQWHAILTGGGMGPSYADLVVELYDAHNAGRIDAESGVGEIRRGTSTLHDVFSSFPAHGC